MTVAVVGSRTFADRDRLFADLDALREEIGPFTMISGGARGADTFAEEWARSRHAPLQVYRADWQTHGRAAGPIRNRAMVERADRVVAFWDGKSQGTQDTIYNARLKGKPVAVLLFGPKPPSTCSYDPRDLIGLPLGMFHCPECGEMVVAGLAHPNYKGPEPEPRAP